VAAATGTDIPGTNLTTLTAQQQIAEICNDRQALLQHGLKPFSFAYPGGAGASNTTIQGEVQGCGYGNARERGQPVPGRADVCGDAAAKSWLALRAYAPSGQVTLANIESLVSGAASHGGGWIPIVIGRVCSRPPTTPPIQQPGRGCPDGHGRHRRIRGQQDLLHHRRVHPDDLQLRLHRPVHGRQHGHGQVLLRR
jgi:hypothetical protein